MIHKEKEQRKIGDYALRSTCRFCASDRLTKVLDFGAVPLAGAFLKEEDFDKEKFYPLEVYFCEDCALVQVGNIVPVEVLFKNYFYFSSSIGTLVEHCFKWAEETRTRFLAGKDNPLVVEIGCNDGVMLKPLAAMGIKSIGVDPATNVVESVKKDGFDIVNDCFTREVAAQIAKKHGKADVILSSYSFAHIDDMQSVIEGVTELLSPQGHLIFEVYYLGTLLDEMQYDMIYHEHFSYYSLHALNHFLGLHGMEIFDTKFTPGVRSGAVRFYARFKGTGDGKKSQAYNDLLRDEKTKGYNRPETFHAYAQKVKKTRDDLMTILDRLKSAGKRIVGYGASGRGTVIMNYCGIDRRYLDYVVDDAPAKHGFCTPGMHVPIKPGSAIEEDRPDYALLFAWSFAKEVVSKRKDYVNGGGKFIVPLPEVKIIP